ncbi:hypothetical protein H6G52_14535 [Limnothrix sp. FACHB-881]|uniref:hypothetical protein n=1 Tax=Limnothrix sp. PR1529 TaxID=1704291 RepID=UPI0019868620|nr:hypothetical protein [Limnothrix sp. PR1529]MBD2636584.1 hypothetical protein [Limnothrix sp. FACHB-881]
MRRVQKSSEQEDGERLGEQITALGYRARSPDTSHSRHFPSTEPPPVALRPQP